MKSDDFIPLSKPYITPQDEHAVLEVLKSPQLSMGERTEVFESAFADLVGAKFALAVNSGTSALHLGVKTIGVEAGDEVIVSPFSFIASANCFVYEGGIPVFTEIEEETFGLDPTHVSQVISDKTKAVLPTQVFGQSCELDEISNIAKVNSLKLFVDSCESITARHHEHNVLEYADMAAYGFYPNKQMTTGEGGMLVTNDRNDYELVKSLRNQGRGSSMEWLVHERLGYNYRISEITAALGYSQVRQLPEIIQKRKILADLYFEELADVEEVILPHVPAYNDHSWFVFAIRVDEEIRNDLLSKLNKKGIQSKVYFHPCIHLQPFYKEKFGFREGQFPVAEKVSKQLLVLPFFTSMTEEQVKIVKKRLVESLVEIRKGI